MNRARAPEWNEGRGTWVSVCLALAALFQPGVGAAEENLPHSDEGQPVSLTRTEVREAGIRTQAVAMRALHRTLVLPGEVAINAYRASRVAPKIAAQALERHVRLGDVVTPGQRLVTLSSLEMAEAQGQLVVADREWHLVTELGEGAVSGRRYTEAGVTRQQAIARVLAFGMTREQVEELSSTGSIGSAVGSFQLTAIQHGTVMNDNFRIGELIEPGRVMFDIVDESSVWVDARIGAGAFPDTPPGTRVEVAADDIVLPGIVLGQHHQLDETTRTRGLRIEVDNTAHNLHPGQFVSVEVRVGEAENHLAVPNSATTLIEGTTSVFVMEHEGEFHPRSVVTGLRTDIWTAIVEGLEPGEQIAVSGVFHLKSLLLKSSLGEGHAH